MKYNRISLALSAAVGLAAVDGSAARSANLVHNGSFETTTLAGKGTFSGNVADWSGGKKLTFLDYPGTADGNVYLAVYGPFARTSPDGGNFVEMDGDPNYSSAISQTIDGLTIGHKYVVTFDQAAGQQKGFNGATTERWRVSLGSDSKLSSKYSLPSHGVGGWEAQSMIFTASATSEVLSFLAKGTPNGEPPISFLDGVSLSAVPEPASWALMLIGVAGLGMAARHRRSAVAA